MSRSERTIPATLTLTSPMSPVYLSVAKSVVGDWSTPKPTPLVTASQYKDAEQQAVLAVKQAFTQMLAAKAAVKVADENLSGYRRTVELSRHRLDAGDISATDFERIDLQLVEFESDDDAAQLSLTQASDQLQLLLGAEMTDPCIRYRRFPRSSVPPSHAAGARTARSN